MLDDVGQCWIMLDETHASILPCQRYLDTKSDNGRQAAGAVRSATFHLRLLCFIEIVASSHAPTAYVTFTFEIFPIPCECETHLRFVFHSVID